MPVHVERRNGRYRLIEPNGDVAATPQGHARDGGGHASRDKAERQARAINSNLSKAKRSLYICRPLLNATDLIDWARLQGFTQTVAAEDMHVTVTWSRTPLDWDIIKPAKTRIIVWEDAGRSVGHLGDEGAVVLLFHSKKLIDRWRYLRELGASWDYPSYHPHVTLTYKRAEIDPTTVLPYRGPLKFGGERFDEVVDDWDMKIDEQKFE